MSHKRLLLRLRESRFSGNILNWFHSCLQDRRQQTTILEATPWPTPVTSGVPQGSILGLLLFLLYENDLPSSISSSTIAIYADDTKTFKEINSLNDDTALQEDLSNFKASSTNTGLQLNASKCKAVCVTRRRKKIEYPYNLKDKTLETSEQERDLGV